MGKKPDEIEKKINRKLAALKQSAKSRSSDNLPNRRLVDRELIDVYGLIKEIYTKPPPIFEIGIALLAYTIMILLWVGIIYIIFNVALKPFVAWIVDTWQKASPEGQILILLSFIGVLWAVFTWWYKNFLSSKKNKAT